MHNTHNSLEWEDHMKKQGQLTCMIGNLNPQLSGGAPMEGGLSLLRVSVIYPFERRQLH